MEAYQLALDAGMPALAATAAIMATTNALATGDLETYERIATEYIRYFRASSNDLFAAESLERGLSNHRLLRGELASASELITPAIERT